jgi:hypothetical protein
MQNNDVAAIRQPDGRYIIRRWIDHRRDRWAFVDGHTGTFKEADMLSRLSELRLTSDTWILDRPQKPRRVE